MLNMLNVKYVNLILIHVQKLACAYMYGIVFSVKCGNKAVKNSYFTVCKPCSDEQQICGKCGQKEDLVHLCVFCLLNVIRHRGIII